MPLPLYLSERSANQVFGEFAQLVYNFARTTQPHRGLHRSTKVLSGKWIRRLVLAASAVLIVASAGNGIDNPTAQLHLLDLNGRQIEPLKTMDARAVVFLFIRSDCPISNRYAPELRRLKEKFASSDIKFWLVYPDPDETPQIIRRHTKEYQYNFSVLRDVKHDLVKLTGVQVTPEAAVFVPEKESVRMVYRGRIDDRFVDFGKARPAPTTRDLEQVLQAIADGKPITNVTTTAIGCFIPDLQ